MTSDPEFYRQRYWALLETARREPLGSPVPNPIDLPPGLINRHDTIPPGWYETYRIPRGHSLRLINHSATQGVSALFWNANDVTDRFSTADTAKIQWRVRLTTGALLYSDMGRVLASITDDTCGHHDLLVGGSSPQSLRRRGLPAGRNSRDNFLLAIAKLGMDRRDIPPCITFFAGVQSGAGGHLSWRDGTTQQGDRIDLRAEMNLIAVVSNCPHPLAPDPHAAGDVEALVWRSPPAAADDFCRTASQEAARAFANIDAASALWPNLAR